MTTRRFAFSSHARAAPETVTQLLDDVDGWTKWARPVVLQTRWETWGHPAQAGPGAVRRLGAWPVWIRELILSNESGLQTYTILSPATFERYHGAVAVTASDHGGTDIDWRIEFVARQRFMGPLFQVVLEATIAALLKRLTAAAENQSEGPCT
jgi:hypothetical protein